MAKRRVPLGKPIIWTQEQLDADAEPTPSNIAKWTQDSVNGWRKYAKAKDLIDAKVSEL